MFGYTPNYGIGLDDSGAPMLGFSPGDSTGGGLGNPAVNIARARSGSIFGIQPPSKNSYMWAGALRAARPVVPHNFGANLIAGLTGGLAGALQGANQYSQVAAQQQMAQANMERQWQLEQIAQQRADTQDRRQASYEDWIRSRVASEDAKQAALEGKNQRPQGVYTQGEVSTQQGPLPAGAVTVPDVAATTPEAMGAYLTTAARNAAGGSEPDILKMSPEQFAQYRDRYTQLHPNQGGGLQGGQLDPQSLDAMTTDYILSGKLPAMGMGGMGLRTQIFNHVPDLLPPGTNLASYRADYQKNQRALSTAQTNYDQQAAFMASIDRNMGPLLGIVDRIPDTGTTFGNWAARGAATATGNPDMAQFNTSMTVLRPEFARILQQGTASGQTLTVEALRDIKGALDNNATVPQLKRALGILVADGNYKLQSYSNQIDQIRGRISLRTPNQNQGIVNYQGQYQGIPAGVAAGSGALPTPPGVTPAANPSKGGPVDMSQFIRKTTP